MRFTNTLVNHIHPKPTLDAKANEVYEPDAIFESREDYLSLVGSADHRDCMFCHPGRSDDYHLWYWNTSKNSAFSQWSFLSTNNDMTSEISSLLLRLRS